MSCPHRSSPMCRAFPGQFHNKDDTLVHFLQHSSSVLSCVCLPAFPPESFVIRMFTLGIDSPSSELVTVPDTVTVYADTGPNAAVRVITTVIKRVVYS